MPAYLIYEAKSMTGTAYTEGDVPQDLRLVAALEAVNGDAALNRIVTKHQGPMLVLRANTVTQGALKINSKGAV